MFGPTALIIGFLLLSAFVIVLGVKLVLRSSPKKADWVLTGITFLFIIAAAISSFYGKLNTGVPIFLLSIAFIVIGTRTYKQKSK
ncbi:hypothetical protein C8Z91_20675 [Paenibacillus elgii]|uniref:Uncharacterized protein n=1 Tax=Paenibacillus elgii TaxID=189691 RepID=A0A2T6FZK9_9BACL|nr:hypothetical protein [Paenibacillus elgii]PUA37325.1 hypothetical protein C8Z91_20675 [Paenibacillus elgii]